MLLFSRYNKGLLYGMKLWVGTTRGQLGKAHVTPFGRKGLRMGGRRKKVFPVAGPVRGHSCKIDTGSVGT